MTDGLAKAGLIWPWGRSSHSETYRKEDRSWCSCGEWCRDPAFTLDYNQVCMCCREPLYELHIAELEAQLEHATACPMCEEGYPLHSCATYLDLVKKVRYLTQELAKFTECKVNIPSPDGSSCEADKGHHIRSVYHRIEM